MIRRSDNEFQDISGYMYHVWFDLHVYLTLVEMAEEIGFWEVHVGTGFDDLSIHFVEV